MKQDVQDVNGAHANYLNQYNLERQIETGIKKSKTEKQREKRQTKALEKKESTEIEKEVTILNDGRNQIKNVENLIYLKPNCQATKKAGHVLSYIQMCHESIKIHDLNKSIKYFEKSKKCYVEFNSKQLYHAKSIFLQGGEDLVSAINIIKQIVKNNIKDIIKTFDKAESEIFYKNLLSLNQCLKTTIELNTHHQKPMKNLLKEFADGVHSEVDKYKSEQDEEFLLEYAINDRCDDDAKDNLLEVFEANELNDNDDDLSKVFDNQKEFDTQVFDNQKKFDTQPSTKVKVLKTTCARPLAKVLETTCTSSFNKLIKADYEEEDSIEYFIIKINKTKIYKNNEDKNLDKYSEVSYGHITYVAEEEFTKFQNDNYELKALAVDSTDQGNML